VHRALAALSLANAGASPDQLARLSIGQRDAQLLDLRESVFGPQLTGQVACPACGEQLELNVSIADVRAKTPPPPETLTLTFGDHEICFRLPNSGDIEAISSSGDAAERKLNLLRRCVLQARRAGQVLDAGDLPGEVTAAICERMAEADPQGDLRLSLNCAQCHHRWQTHLDIASFFWTELNAWAVRLFRDVHVLASTYGWSESDILAMTPWRRQAYLEMVER
jgi:hypothetical protein